MPEHAPGTRLLFLTKSDCVDDILELNHGGQSVISFSVNTDTVFDATGTQNTISRFPTGSLLQKFKKQDMKCAFRIDPIIFYSTWEKDYRELVNKIFQFVRPARITLGEYRPSNGLANHISSRFPESALLRVHDNLVKEGGKLRYPRESKNQDVQNHR